MSLLLFFVVLFALADDNPGIAFLAVLGMLFVA